MLNTTEIKNKTVKSLLKCLHFVFVYINNWSNIDVVRSCDSIGF